VDKGFKVIRFDNRDSGSSVYIPGKEIDLNGNIEEFFSGLKPEDIPYALMDMARCYWSADYLHIDKAHFAGRSMGGIITQLLGSYFPERVLTLTIIMSTSLNPGLQPTHPEILGMMMKPPADPNLERKIFSGETVFC
jgi:pimeloyl-ACP methyl ester carboxylesterase